MELATACFWLDLHTLHLSPWPSSFLNLLSTPQATWNEFSYDELFAVVYSHLLCLSSSWYCWTFGSPAHTGGGGRSPWVAFTFQPPGDLRETSQSHLTTFVANFRSLCDLWPIALYSPTGAATPRARGSSCCCYSALLQEIQTGRLQRGIKLSLTCLGWISVFNYMWHCKYAFSL